MKIENLKLKINAGFTLIEILIVIALLGALAVGLLATVDPFEQLKKGSDTSTRNTASEVYNAAIRYYSVKNEFPWKGSDITGVSIANDMFTADPSSGYLRKIISAGELKPEFIQLAGGSLNDIFITSTAVGGVQQNVTVCFLPGSKSFSNEGNSKYNVKGEDNTTAGCPGAVGSCYWCIK